MFFKKNHKNRKVKFPRVPVTTKYQKLPIEDVKAKYTIADLVDSDHLANTLLATTVPAMSGLEQFTETIANCMLFGIDWASGGKIEMTQFYFNLNPNKNEPGGEIFRSLIKFLNDGGDLTLVVSYPLLYEENIKEFSGYPNCKIIYVDMEKYYGGGVMHAKTAKFTKVNDDGTSSSLVYVGSANMGNSSYKTTGEVGLFSTNDFIVSEVDAFIGIFKTLGTNGAGVKVVQSKARPFNHMVPDLNPEDYKQFRSDHTLKSPKTTVINGVETNVCVGFNPKECCMGRNLERHLLCHIFLFGSGPSGFVIAKAMTWANYGIYGIPEVRQNENGTISKVGQRWVLSKKLPYAIGSSIITQRNDVSIVASRYSREHSGAIMRTKMLCDYWKTWVVLRDTTDAVGDVGFYLVKNPGLQNPQEKHMVFENMKYGEDMYVYHGKAVASDRACLITTSNVSGGERQAGISIYMYNEKGEKVPDIVLQMQRYLYNVRDSETSRRVS